MAVVKVTARPDPGLGLTAQGQQRDVALRPPADVCEPRVHLPHLRTVEPFVSLVFKYLRQLTYNKCYMASLRPATL